MQSINLPFWLAAICSAFPLVFIQVWVTRSVAASEGKNAAIWSPSVLLRDKALLWFTLSAFLASFVGAPLRPVFHSTLWSLPIAASRKKW